MKIRSGEESDLRVLPPARSSDRALICLLDQDGRVLRANDMLRQWGCGESGAARGHDLHTVLHADCVVDNCYLRHFCERGTAEIAEGRRVECDAFDPVLNRFINIRGEPACLGSGRMDDAESASMAMMVVDDVSEALLAEKRVVSLNLDLSRQLVREIKRRKEEEQIRLRMQMLIECTANFVAMCDARGTLSYLNPAARSMLGIDPDMDVSAMSVFELHTADAAGMLRDQALPVARAEGKWVGRSVLSSRRNEEINTSQVVIAHAAADGRNEGFSIVEHDMTAWLKGEQALRESHAEMAHLSAKLISVQEAERYRIAADIHDGIGQTLSLIKIRVAAAAAHLENGGTKQALAMLRDLVPQVQDAIGDVRRVTTDLHPSSLEDLGILATLSWFFREVESACQDIRLERDFAVSEADIHPSLRIVIFRIFQEAVSNIVKHAMPQCIRVALRCNGKRLMLSIEDDGCGFDPGSFTGVDCAARGFGLSSMKERARLSGGAYELSSVVGQGTCIRVEWPMPLGA